TLRGIVGFMEDAVFGGGPARVLRCGLGEEETLDCQGSANDS
ncbi:98_t:CDS:1, partial [Racocetra fulgida]